MVGVHQARASIAHLYHAAARRRRSLAEHLPDLVVLVVSVATVIGVWFAAQRYAAAEHLRLEARMKAVSADLVVALAEEVERTLDAARQAAAFIAHTYERDREHLDLSRWSVLHSMDAFPSASIIDGQGKVITASEGRDSFDYGALPFFQQSRDAAPGQLLIGDPVVGESGRVRIPTLMAIPRADGEFVGFVVIWLRADRFGDAYWRTALAPEDAMAVVGTDGAIRLQFGRPMGKSAEPGGSLQKILASPYSSGTFIDVATVDGAGTDATARPAKTRIMAYGLMARYPLFAVVGLDYENAFAAFYARARTYYEVAAAVSLVVALLAAALLFMLAKQRATARELQMTLAEEALHDALTGLANRTLFQDHCARAMARAQRHAYNVAVLYLDLDDFKPINDQYGHAVGDLVLQEVSMRLQSCVRAASEDLVARLGGDEFCVILSNVNRVQCERIVGKILRALAEPMEFGRTCFELTASIGAALFPDETEDVEMLIDLADRGMYEAKRAGKNEFRWGVTAPQFAKAVTPR